MIRPYGALVVRSSLLAKWSKEWVRDRLRVRAGARECNTSFFVAVLVGASLSEPHTSGTAMHNACVCMSELGHIRKI